MGHFANYNAIIVIIDYNAAFDDYCDCFDDDFDDVVIYVNDYYGEVYYCDYFGDDGFDYCYFNDGYYYDYLHYSRICYSRIWDHYFLSFNDFVKILQIVVCYYCGFVVYVSCFDFGFSFDHQYQEHQKVSFC